MGRNGIIRPAGGILRAAEWVLFLSLICWDASAADGTFDESRKQDEIVVTASRLAPTVVAGEGRTVPVVVVGPDLTVRAGQRRYQRLDGASWRIEGDGRAQALVVDDRGLPVWPATAGEWPLELDEQHD